MIQRTLVLIKPDGVKRALIGEILSRFERSGMKISGLKMIWPTEEMAHNHYEEHLDKDFFEGLRVFLTSGPVVAIVLEGINAVKKVRKMIGTTQAGEAQPGTIRGDFGLATYDFADSNNLPVVNLVHASATPDEAENEINIWFEEEELHEYDPAHHEYVTGTFI